MEREKELRVLRGVVKALLKKELRYVEPNSFNRGLTSQAEALGVSLEDLRAVVVPIVSELFSEMIAEPTARRSGGPGPVRKNFPDPKVFEIKK